VGSFEKSVRSDDDNIGLCAGTAGERDSELLIEFNLKDLALNFEPFLG
jgi:hypothetical protein